MLVFAKRPTRVESDKNGFVVKQNIKIRSNILRRENFHKCLACGGIPMLQNGKITGFYPKNQPYPHKNGCEAEGRF